MGACCSISRQALILSRRQTQHSGSLPPKTIVSAAHTEHFAAFLKRSVDIDCFACSSISAGTTGSDFICNLRFITTQSAYTMTESVLPNNLGSFRHLYHHRHFQRRSASRTLGTLGHTWHLTLQFDVGGHGMRADRAVRQPLCVPFHQISHFQPPYWFRRKSMTTGLRQHRKIF